MGSNGQLQPAGERRVAVALPQPGNGDLQATLLSCLARPDSWHPTNAPHPPELIFTTHILGLTVSLPMHRFGFSTQLEVALAVLAPRAHTRAPGGCRRRRLLAAAHCGKPHRPGPWRRYRPCAATAAYRACRGMQSTSIF